MNFRKPLFAFGIILVSLTTSPAALAREQQILSVKVEGFPDTRLTLVTDAKDMITAIRIDNDKVHKQFKPEQFKEGYTHRYYGFKAVTVRSPDLDPAKGGTIQLEFRMNATVFSEMGKIRARLKKDDQGDWILEGEKAKSSGYAPFKILEMTVKKEPKGDGTYKFLGIKDYKFSALPDFDALVAQLSPNEHRNERLQQLSSIFRHPKPNDKPVMTAKDFTESESTTAPARAL